MVNETTGDRWVGVLREAVVTLIRRAEPDLSSRQFGIFLTSYLTEGPHTVRGLAAHLNISKPAVTRALDRLEELDLARRKIDPMDRRSVLVQQTAKGAGFLKDLRGILRQAVTKADEGISITDTPANDLQPSMDQTARRSA